MAEPKNLDEALSGYQEGRFSRKSMFEFVVAELKSIRAAQEATDKRLSDLMAALMKPEAVQIVPASPEKFAKAFPNPKGNGKLEAAHG